MKMPRVRDLHVLGADLVSEGRLEPFAYLLNAAEETSLDMIDLGDTGSC